MTRTWILAGVLWLAVGVMAAGAGEPAAGGPAQESAPRGPLAAVRTAAYLPFKGVVCVVGVVASFPVYWLSGMDPHVKADTETVRAQYCSREYLLGADWPR